MRKALPKRVVAVVAPLALVAGLLGSQTASFLSVKAAPYLAFGTQAHRQSIKVSGGDLRHRIEFSNGVTVQGLRLLPLLGFWALLCTVFILSLLFVLLRIASWIVRKWDAPLADDLLHFWSLSDERHAAS